MVPKNIFLILAISLIFINLSLAQTEEYKGGFAAGQQDAIVAGLGEIGWNCGYYGGVEIGMIKTSQKDSPIADTLLRWMRE
jgi:hypothetical protein